MNDELEEPVENKGAEDIEEAEDVEEVAPALESVSKVTVPSVLIVDDPYDWNKCQVTISMTWLPDDGDPAGRIVVLAGRTHNDAPVIHCLRETEIGSNEILALLIGDLRTELMASMDERAVTHQKAVETEAKKVTERKVEQFNKRSNYVPPVSFHSDLLGNQDILNSKNTSPTALKMLKDLVDKPLQNYKNFKRVWKDQPVLEMLTIGQIIVEGENIIITPKGKEIYDWAIAWKPKPESKQKKVTVPEPKQVSLF